MNDHIYEETYTKAQMREAWQEAADDTLLHTRPTFTRFMAALNKPLIHPNVPVMYDSKHDEGLICLAEDLVSMDTNIRVLIPEETVREIARRAITRHTAPTRVVGAMREVDRDIADYRVNGPGDTP